MAGDGAPACQRGRSTHASPRINGGASVAASRPASLFARLLASNRYWSAAAVKQARAALEGRAFDLILANDVDAVPLALHLAGPRTRLLLDAHEYAPGEFADRLHWRLLYQAYKTWLCRTGLPRVHGFTTVCDGIADEYARVFHVPHPLVVPNVPPRQPGEPRPTPRDAIRLVHHGLASRSRQIETMIDLMRHLDRRFTLDLVDELKAAGQDVNSARLGEHVVAKTVCRHAVKANDPLAGRELENLVEDLRRCAMPYTCPHGRPTIIEMNYRELERKFGRTQ